MKQSLLHYALTLAIQKRDNHTQKRFIHFAFIVQNNKIVEWGRNRAGSPAKHYGYHDRIDDKKFRPKTHAELDCFKKAKGLLDKNKPFEVINIRLNRLAELRLSCPCSVCYRILKNWGCRRFYYSSNIGFLSIT